MVAVLSLFLTNAANPERDISQHEEDNFWKRFLILSGTSVQPVCKADLDVSCTVDRDGSDCNRLTLPITVECVCDECVTEFVFRYSAASCASGKTAGLVDCEDFSASGPSIVAANIKIHREGRVLTDTIIPAGSNAIVGDGSCMGNSVFIEVSDPITGDLQQIIEIDTSCRLGSHIELLESFGALDFVGYTCKGQEAQNCFEDTTYAMLARNTGGVDLSVSEFSVDISGVTTDLTEDLTNQQIMLSPGDDIQSNKKVIFERCIESIFYYKATLVGKTLGGTACTDQEERPGQALEVGLFVMAPTKIKYINFFVQSILTCQFALALRFSLGLRTQLQLQHRAQACSQEHTRVPFQVQNLAKLHHLSRMNRHLIRQL